MRETLLPLIGWSKSGIEEPKTLSARANMFWKKNGKLKTRANITCFL
ncbi:MAG: hypothetical protein PHR99_03495 [Methanobacteriales archaeon]|nr:hypothetical protein [Methanobacteriales archaeon]